MVIKYESFPDKTIGDPSDLTFESRQMLPEPIHVEIKPMPQLKASRDIIMNGILRYGKRNCKVV